MLKMVTGPVEIREISQMGNRSGELFTYGDGDPVMSVHYQIVGENEERQTKLLKDVARDAWPESGDTVALVLVSCPFNPLAVRVGGGHAYSYCGFNRVDRR
jgi:hypothetical protein